MQIQVEVNDIDDVVTALKLHLNLTAAQLARVLGVKPNTITNWQRRGKSQVPNQRHLLSPALRAAQRLGCKVIIEFPEK